MADECIVLDMPPAQISLLAFLQRFRQKWGFPMDQGTITLFEIYRVSQIKTVRETQAAAPAAAVSAASARAASIYYPGK